MYVTTKTETQQDAEKGSGTGGMDTGRVYGARVGKEQRRGLEEEGENG